MIIDGKGFPVSQSSRRLDLLTLLLLYYISISIFKHRFSNNQNNVKDNRRWRDRDQIQIFIYYPEEHDFAHRPLFLGIRAIFGTGGKN